MHADGLVFSVRRENRFRLAEGFLAGYHQRPTGMTTIGEVTLLRTYAQKVVDRASGLERLEHWWEICKRVVEYEFGALVQQVRSQGQWIDVEALQELAQDAFERMFVRKWMPPGRGVQFMGTDAVELKGGGVLNNCGFASTKNIHVDFAEPFCVVMDYLMLGVGMGSNMAGAGKVVVQKPDVDPLLTFVVEDTREGWVDALRHTLNAYVGRNPLCSGYDFSRVRPEGAPLKTFGGTASGYKPLEYLLLRVRAVLDALVGRPITSQAIADIHNNVGRCVVAGNIRRSAEIMLGDPADASFVGLKDPSRLIEIRAAQRAIAEATPAWTFLQREIEELRAEQKPHSVLADEWAVWQDLIDAKEAAQKEILAEDEAWAALEAEYDAHPLSTHRWASNNTVVCEVGQDYSKLAQMTIANGEPGYFWLDVARRYGRRADAPTDVDALTEGCNPCSEQQLEDLELCTLVETYPSRCDDLEDWKRTLKVAYLYAKVVTLIPTHNPKTNAVISRNRRIGTSMAGVFELYERIGLRELKHWCDEGYAYITKLDKSYSGWMGIGRSIKRTSIKPGGSVPLIADVEGGMKVPTSEYYMRTIRFDYLSPLVPALKAAGYKVELDRKTPRTVVVYFPCHNTKTKRVARDVSLWEQALIFTALQRHWSDNMVSATLTFQPHEAQDIPRLLEAYEGQWKSVSFLPLFDHPYPQAPYIPCSKDDYDAAVARIRELDVSAADHESDDKYCSGDKCVAPMAG